MHNLDLIHLILTFMSLGAAAILLFKGWLAARKGSDE